MDEKEAVLTCVLALLFFDDCFSAAFGETVDGKNENMSTHELSGGARIHYIFQAIFVKSLEVRLLFSEKLARI